MSSRTMGFPRESVPTIKASLAVWNARTDIPARKKRRVTQDVLKACEWIGISPDDLRAHPANLNPRLNRLTPGMVGAGDRRISNVRNSIKTLLRAVDYGFGRSFKAELSPKWVGQAALVPNRYLAVSVQSLMQFSSARGIDPVDVDDEVSAALFQALENDRLNGNPKITHQNCVRASNKLGRLGIGWEVPLLKPPRYGNVKIQKWEELPEWCHALTLEFINRSTTTDPYDLTKPFKKWRPETVKTYEVLLRRFFSAAARITDDFECAMSWCDVTNLGFVEKTLRSFTDQHNGKKGWVMVSAMAFLLGQIAKNPDFKAKLTAEETARNCAQAQELFELAVRLRSSNQAVGKNRERVSPFKDEANLARLFLLPFALERELVRSRTRRRRLALLAQWAVALMILTFCPLRISTLSRLADRHLKWSRPGRRGQLTLELEADMMKAGEPASIPLPPECARLIKLYCDKYRADLLGKATAFLFPGAQPDRSKQPGVLATQIAKLVSRRTGLTVNPHLYRHLVHIVILRRFPGAYVMISRVLTHRSLDTAVRNYAYFDTELSIRAYQRLIMEVQDGTRSQKIDDPNQIAYSQSEYDHAPRQSSRKLGPR